MRYEKLRTELLAVREQRELRRLQAGLNPGWTLIQLTLNFPGPDKVPPGAKTLFDWGLHRLQESLPIEYCSDGCDLLGPWALLGVRRTAIQLKQQTVKLESSVPAGRLLDIDVYDRSGNQLGRSDYDLPPRPCLICSHPAVDCIRQQTHDQNELKVRADELLAPYRS